MWRRTSFTGRPPSRADSSALSIGASRPSKWLISLNQRESETGVCGALRNSSSHAIYMFSSLMYCLFLGSEWLPVSAFDSVHRSSLQHLLFRIKFPQAKITLRSRVRSFDQVNNLSYIRSYLMPKSRVLSFDHVIELATSFGTSSPKWRLYCPCEYFYMNTTTKRNFDLRKPESS